MLTISGQLPFYTFLFSAWRAFDFPDLALCARGRLPQLLSESSPRKHSPPRALYPQRTGWFVGHGISGFHFLTDESGMPLKSEHTASQRTPEFSTSVILRGCIWKSPTSSHRTEWRRGHGRHADWLSRKSQRSPRIEKERRGVGTLKLLSPHRFQAPVLPMNIYPLDLVWQLSAEPLQTGI